jgi:hypothetical protein
LDLIYGKEIRLSIFISLITSESSTIIDNFSNIYIINLRAKQMKPMYAWFSKNDLNALRLASPGPYALA